MGEPRSDDAAGFADRSSAQSALIAALHAMQAAEMPCICNPLAGALTADCQSPVQSASTIMETKHTTVQISASNVCSADAGPANAQPLSDAPRPGRLPPTGLIISDQRNGSANHTLWNACATRCLGACSVSASCSAPGRRRWMTVRFGARATAPGLPGGPASARRMWRVGSVRSTRPAPRPCWPRPHGSDLDCSLRTTRELRRPRFRSLLVGAGAVSQSRMGRLAGGARRQPSAGASLPRC